MNFDEYVESIPRLHSWDQGKTWNTGGFVAKHLKGIHALAKSIPAGARIIETGAGNSTITFLYANPKRLVTIAPDAPVFERIRKFCQENGVNASAFEPIDDRSEAILPQLAAADGAQFDLGLIDGCHNWPAVFVDFCYINMMLGKGGLLLVDDIQLYSIKELARCLMQQKEFKLRVNLEKLLVFEKQTDAKYLPEWIDEPYILARSKADEAAGEVFAITGPPPRESLILAAARKLDRAFARFSR